MQLHFQEVPLIGFHPETYVGTVILHIILKHEYLGDVQKSDMLRFTDSCQYIDLARTQLGCV